MKKHFQQPSIKNKTVRGKIENVIIMYEMG